jgi:shikimate kinase
MVLKRVLGGKHQVVALGGGALLDPESRKQVEEKGRVVYLSAALDQLLQRLEAEPGARPLLSGDARPACRSCW